MKTNKDFFNMIASKKNGTHGTTYMIAELLQHVEHEGIKEKMIQLNNEYNEWLDRIVDEHWRQQTK